MFRENAKGKLATFADAFHGSPAPSLCAKPLTRIQGDARGKERPPHNPGMAWEREMKGRPARDKAAVQPLSAPRAWGVSAGGDQGRSGAGGRSGAKQPLPKMDKAGKTLLIHLPFFTDSAGLGGLRVRRP